jgi:hypothetical protein
MNQGKGGLGGMEGDHESGSNRVRRTESGGTSLPFEPSSARGRKGGRKKNRKGERGTDNWASCDRETWEAGPTCQPEREGEWGAV